VPLHPISPRAILLLFTDLHIGLPSGHFPSGFPADNLHESLSPYHLCYMPCQSHAPWPNHSNYTWRRVQVIQLYQTSSHWCVDSLPPQHGASSGYWFSYGR
jgi:hypothetical protein